MSGYIHVLKDLLTAPEFERFTKRLASERGRQYAETLALGCLVKLWLRADSHIREDNTLDLGAEEIDEFLGIEQVSRILGPNYLEILDSHQIRLPGYMDHNGLLARRRAQATARQQKHRAKAVTLAVTPTVTLPVTQACDKGRDLLSSSHPLPSSPSPALKKNGAHAPIAPPEGLNREAWERWEDYRRQIKHPLKPVSVSLAQKQMAALGERQMEAVEHTIGKGWTGLRLPDSRGSAEPKLTWRPGPDD